MTTTPGTIEGGTIEITNVETGEVTTDTLEQIVDWDAYMAHLETLMNEEA